jgi:hypothetical protein
MYDLLTSSFSYTWNMRQCDLIICISLYFPNRWLYIIHPMDFGSVLQNYEAIDRFSDSIIMETNAAHNGQVLYFWTRSRCCTKISKLVFYYWRYRIKKNRVIFHYFLWIYCFNRSTNRINYIDNTYTSTLVYNLWSKFDQPLVSVVIRLKVIKLFTRLSMVLCYTQDFRISLLSYSNNFEKKCK